MTIPSRLLSLFGAANSIGAGPILKAAEKIAPYLVPFTSAAGIAGYGASQIIDFLKDRLTPPSKKRQLDQLTRRTSQGIARPDEQAELVESESRREPLERLAGAAKFGAQATAGLGAAGAASQQQLMEQQAAALQQEQRASAEMQREQQREAQSQFAREKDLERDVERRANEERRFKLAEKYFNLAKEKQEKLSVSQKERESKKTVTSSKAALNKAFKEGELSAEDKNILQQIDRYLGF